MARTYDAIVVGLGAVGSAAVYHLARRGQRVLGLDRFVPPHAQGSSHGGSRIIRRAYFEGMRYLPLLERGYALWEQLEAATGEALVHTTGGLHLGPPGGALVEGAQQAAEALALDYERLDAAAVRARFPAFHLPDDHVAIWEAGAGFLVPERCIAAHLAEAHRHGATLHTDEPALTWKQHGDGVRVTTPRGTYAAGRLVLAAGGWLATLLPDLHLPLLIERQVNAWFEPHTQPEVFAPARCPIFIWEQAGDDVFYGFPDAGAGVKVGLHHRGAVVERPEAVERTVLSEDVDDIRAPLRRLLPAADGPPTRAAVCFYTNTPDRHYLIDRHPAHEGVVFASACSGHGFKASCAIGEALAHLALGTPPPVDVSAFRMEREA